MAVIVERIPDQPIIVAVLSGDITSEMVQEMFAQSAALADEIGEQAYRITDIRLSEISFSDLVVVLADSASGQPGSPSDPRIHGVLVGTHGWSKFFVTSAHQAQYGEMNIPIFEDMETAQAYIRERMMLDRP